MSSADDALVEFEDVNKYFGDIHVLKDITLEVERQEVAVWNTLGRMNDYLSVVDEKPGELEAEPRWFGGGE